ncbi:MAG: hypothetical protein J1F60_03215 [Oscillospiraceae bacterium]|nr:hypothetical protein [Oscillospiraceae bacterium]
MKKRILAAALAALLLSACSNADSDADATTGSTAAPVTTTTPKVNAVEEQPENTTAQTTPAPDSNPEGFPVPYPTGSVDDPETLAAFKSIIEAAVIAESVLDGEHTLIPLGSGVGDDYYLISADYATDLDSLTERMYGGIKYTFWQDQYGWDIEDRLAELVKETEQGIALYCGAAEQPCSIDVSTAVLTYLSGDKAKVVALGTLGDGYIWRTYDMLEGVRGWVVQAHSDEDVSGEIGLFTQLLINQRSTLDTIFGNVTPVTDENGDWNIQLVTIEDDAYGHGFYNGLEIEPFMTVAEMRQYLRDTFTSEIAESYISLYVNRTYVEKDGRLYIISGSILPQMGEFSLANYENRSLSTYDVTSLVEWTDGTDSYTVPVTVSFRDGRWKLDTRLPMMKDRIIK